MNREEIKRKGLGSSSTLGYARRRRKSSSRIFLGTWAWKSNQCAFVFSIVIFEEERGEENQDAPATQLAEQNQRRKKGPSQWNLN